MKSLSFGRGHNSETRNLLDVPGYNDERRLAQVVTLATELQLGDVVKAYLPLAAASNEEFQFAGTVVGRDAIPGANTISKHLDFAVLTTVVYADVRYGAKGTNEVVAIRALAGEQVAIPLSSVDCISRGGCVVWNRRADAGGESIIRPVLRASQNAELALLGTPAIDYDATSCNVVRGVAEHGQVGWYYTSSWVVRATAACGAEACALVASSNEDGSETARFTVTGFAREDRRSAAEAYEQLSRLLLSVEGSEAPDVCRPNFEKATALKHLDHLVSSAVQTVSGMLRACLSTISAHDRKSKNDFCQRVSARWPALVKVLRSSAHRKAWQTLCSHATDLVYEEPRQSWHLAVHLLLGWIPETFAALQSHEWPQEEAEVTRLCTTLLRNVVYGACIMRLLNVKTLLSHFWKWNEGDRKFEALFQANDGGGGDGGFVCDHIAATTSFLMCVVGGTNDDGRKLYVCDGWQRNCGDRFDPGPRFPLCDSLVRASFPTSADEQLQIETKPVRYHCRVFETESAPAVSTGDEVFVELKMGDNRHDYRHKMRLVVRSPAIRLPNGEIWLFCCNEERPGFTCFVKGRWIVDHCPQSSVGVLADASTTTATEVEPTKKKKKKIRSMETDDIVSQCKTMAKQMCEAMVLEAKVTPEAMNKKSLARRTLLFEITGRLSDGQGRAFHDALTSLTDVHLDMLCHMIGEEDSVPEFDEDMESALKRMLKHATSSRAAAAGSGLR